MDADRLSVALNGAAMEILGDELKLMDNHHQAPGYILFETDEPGKFISYLVFKPTADSTIPFIFAFILTSEMDESQVKLAVTEAQEKFATEIKRLEKLAKAEMVSVKGNDVNPVLWTGGSLKAFGQNPYGENIWRVVWAPSRMWQVGGRWQDREQGKIVRTVDEYRWIPRYGGENGWVLEKWLSAEEYAKCTEELWNMVMRDAETGLLELGPYPSRGVFEAAYTFSFYPPYSLVEKRIQMINYGKQKYSQNDIKLAHRDALDAREKAKDDKLEEMIRDAMPAFPIRGLSGSPYRSAPDDFKVTAKDIAKKGMPNAAKDFRQVN